MLCPPGLQLATVTIQHPLSTTCSGSNLIDGACAKYTTGGWLRGRNIQVTNCLKKKTEAATSPMAQVNGRPIQCTTKPLAVQVVLAQVVKKKLLTSPVGGGGAYIYLL